MDKWDIPPFKFKALPRNEVRSEWIKYKRHFMYVVSSTGERDRTRIKNIFLAKAEPDLQEVFSTIPGADVEGSRTVDPFEVAIEKLDNYFAPKQHETFERNVFWTLRPSAGESLEKFTIRCTDQASKCNFGSTVGESRAISVIDKVILFAPSDLKEKLLQVEDLNIDEMKQPRSSAPTNPSNNKRLQWARAYRTIQTRRQTSTRSSIGRKAGRNRIAPAVATRITRAWMKTARLGTGSVRNANGKDTLLQCVSQLQSESSRLRPARASVGNQNETEKSGKTTTNRQRTSSSTSEIKMS